MKIVPQILAFTFLLLTACEVVVSPDELEIGENIPQIVIEGYITNQAPPYTVSIQKTSDFFGTSDFENIDNATVTISDHTGQTEVLTYTESGIYKTDTFQGIEGRQYFLEVIIETKTYTASSVMPPATILTDLTYQYKTATAHVNEAGYFVTAYAQDDANQTNFYRIKGFKNGNPFTDGDSYLLLNDYVLNGNEMITECNFNYAQNDTAKIQLMAIDFETYRFYNSLKQQLTSGTGNNFALPPSNVVGNIEGGAIGVFSAYAVSEMEVLIE